VGHGNIKGYFVRPAEPAGKLPVVIVIHENRGLNPYIEDVARRLATATSLLRPAGLRPAPIQTEKRVPLVSALAAGLSILSRCGWVRI
jgi:hypothetical protein